MNRVRQSPLDLGAANVPAVLAGIAAKALDQRPARPNAEAKANLNAQLTQKRLYLPDWRVGREKIQKAEHERSGTDRGIMQRAPSSDPKQVAEMECKNGHEVTSSYPPTAVDVSCRRLKSIADLIEFYEEVMNRAQQGAFGLDAAKTLAVFAGMLLKAIDQRAAGASPEGSGQLYARRLYLPDWRRETIERLQKEGQEKEDREKGIGPATD